MSEQYLPTYIDNVDNSISIVDSSDSISYYKTENAPCLVYPVILYPSRCLLSKQVILIVQDQSQTDIFKKTYPLIHD